MNSEKEILLHFSSNKNNWEDTKYIEFEEDIIIKSHLEDISISPGKFKGEWQQEYFLIYNSYRMEETYLNRSKVDQ